MYATKRYRDGVVWAGIDTFLDIFDTNKDALIDNS
jgi:hypothetical protein